MIEKLIQLEIISKINEKYKFCARYKQTIFKCNVMQEIIDYFEEYRVQLERLILNFLQVS
jgi:hypothetical protein